MTPPSERSRAVAFLRSADSTAPDRRWCGNDDSARAHHGIVALAETPLVLELSWRASKAARKALVCRLRLDLARLLAERLVRAEDAKQVRLRFFHDHDGKVYIQVKQDAPRFLIGRV